MIKINRKKLFSVYINKNTNDTRHLIDYLADALEEDTSLITIIENKTENPVCIHISPAIRAAISDNLKGPRKL